MRSQATRGVFCGKSHGLPLERKNNNEVESFSTLFLMSTLTWITEKRVIQKRRRISLGFHSGGEKMRNARSGQQGDNKWQ